MFSLDDATTSENKSDKVAKTTINTVTTVTGKNFTENEKKEFVVNSRFIIRKMAHFTLYFILGILAYITLRNYNVDNKIILFSVLICFIYAISDEIHQLFSTGRTFKILDIIIDSIGGFIGTIISNLSTKKLAFFKKIWYNM